MPDTRSAIIVELSYTSALIVEYCDAPVQALLSEYLFSVSCVERALRVTFESCGWYERRSESVIKGMSKAGKENGKKCEILRLYPT